jgi:hypothetical protein
MKKLLLLVAGATIMGLVSCDKVKDMIKFNVGVQSQNVDFAVPILTNAGEQTLASESVTVNIDSIIKTKNASAGVGNIKSAKVTEVILEVQDADGDNSLGIVESAKVMLSSDTKTEMVTIAELTGNPDEYKTAITIPANGDVDLADYLKANTYSYTLLVTTRRGTTKELHCKAIIKYDLVVGLDSGE